MYKLHISAHAKAQIKNLSWPRQKAVLQALQEIKEEPLWGKPLALDLAGKRSYRVGVYRIIYKIYEKDKTIKVFAAGHRSIIYN